MRLVITEKKKRLNESDERSTIEVSMTPFNFLKLTTEYADSNAIYNFISGRKHEEAIKIDSINKRKAFVEKQLGSSKTPTAVQLLLGGINFIKPAVDAIRWGAFDEDKSVPNSLFVEVNGDVGKVINHEGRNKTVYKFMKDESKLNVLITLDKDNINTVQSLPRTFISQFDDKNKVFKNDIAPMIEKEANKFRTIEGFINSLGPFPKQAVIDNLKQKTIKVGDEEVTIMKAVMVDKKPDGSYTSSIFKVGLYDREALNVPRSDGIEYWVEIDKHRLPLDRGPVTIS